MSIEQHSQEEHAPPSPELHPYLTEDITLEARLARIESKLDSVGEGTNWMMRQVDMMIKGLLASPMGAMIRKGMPRGN